MTIETPGLESLVQARVLIVEDEGIVAKDLQNSLRALGYSVCGTCADGRQAVASAEELRPDLILMDIRLSGDMDGIETAHRIRARHDLPVVFLTAYADPDTLRRAAEIGPYGYVLKPFDDRELQVTIMMAMCKHRAFAELDRRVQKRTEALFRTEAKYRRLQSVAELGLFALGTRDTDAVMQRAVALASEMLEIEFVSVLEVKPGGKSLLLRAGKGWDEGLVGSATVPADPSLQSGYTLGASAPVVVSDVRSDTRFEPTGLFADHGFISGMSVVIHAPGPNGCPYGVIAVHARRPRQYSEHDVNFLQAVGNVVATAIMRSASDTKILEAKRAAQDERIRAAVAEEALQARDEFLSVAAHELRTPVAALQLQMDALHELLKTHGESLDARIPERAGRATKTVGRLARLIEGVLDVSRIALGSLQLDAERFDLADLVRDVAARHEDLAQRAGCEIRTTVSERVSGCWDRVRIEQVMTNLLSNALKFGAGRPIEVGVGRRESGATITVSDRGEGIDPGDVKRIMGRFERAASHRHYGGLGLGLYIAEKIVDAHGGSLEVSSSPGEGAALTVFLPLGDR